MKKIWRGEIRSHNSGCNGLIYLTGGSVENAIAEYFTQFGAKVEAIVEEADGWYFISHSGRSIVVYRYSEKSEEKVFSDRIKIIKEEHNLLEDVADMTNSQAGA